MQAEEFIDRVEQYGPAIDRESARAATLSTLQALCEHLPYEEGRRLAAQLPEELAEAIDEGRKRKRGDISRQPIELSAFYDKVSRLSGVPHADATGYTRAVMRTLKQAVTDGEITDVALELPPRLDELLAKQ